MVHMHPTAVNQEWRGIPTRLNNIPHSREIREYFYNDVVKATKLAIEDKKTRLQVATYLFHLC
jgi:adenylate kinase